MRCCHCKIPVAAGAEARKMIVEYTQPDGTTKIFGYMMTDGPLPAATGQILRGYHHKCYHLVRKREGRGDAVTGRVLNGAPTAYDIGAQVMTRDEAAALGLSDTQIAARGTGYLSKRLAELREVARSIGKGVGDATVLEAFWAKENDGPYAHTHHLRLEVYQLRAHLSYAHAADYTQVALTGRGGVHRLHEELHAAAALHLATQARQGDPDRTDERAERDWRDQSVLDVEEVTAAIPEGSTTP